MLERLSVPKVLLKIMAMIKLIILRELQQRHQSWVQLVTRVNPMAIEEGDSESGKKTNPIRERKR